MQYADTAPGPRPSSRGALVLAVGGLGILVLLGTCYVVLQIAGLGEEGSDFLYYWLGGVAVAHGAPLYPWAAEATRFEDVGYVFCYPPLIAMLFALLASTLDYFTARWLWLAVSVALMGLAAVLTWRTSGLAEQWRSIWAWLPAFGLLPWALVSLAMGQFSAVLFLIVAVAFWASLHGRPGWGGSGIGIGAALKLTPALILVYWALRREWRAVAVGIAVGGTLGLLSLAVVGPGAYLDYFTRVIPVYRSIDAIPGNVSLVGFWTKLLVPNPYTFPFMELPAAGGALKVASVLAVLAATAYAVVRAPRDAEGTRRSFALTVAAMLLMTPMNGAYNLVIAAVPLTVATALCNRRGGRAQAMVAAVTFLLMFPIGGADAAPGLDMVSWRGGWALLLAQGTFAGLLGLWALMWYLCRETHALQATAVQREPQADDPPHSRPQLA